MQSLFRDMAMYALDNEDLNSNVFIMDLFSEKRILNSPIFPHGRNLLFEAFVHRRLDVASVLVTHVPGDKTGVLAMYLINNFSPEEVAFYTDHIYASMLYAVKRNKNDWINFLHSIGNITPQEMMSLAIEEKNEYLLGLLRSDNFKVDVNAHLRRAIELVKKDTGREREKRVRILKHLTMFRGGKDRARALLEMSGQLGVPEAVAMFTAIAKNNPVYRSKKREYIDKWMKNVGDICNKIKNNEPVSDSEILYVLKVYESHSFTNDGHNSVASKCQKLIQKMVADTLTRRRIKRLF